MDNNIYILDKNTATKIAAGEVVEKPFNVVKELIENSLDAGATKIFVDLLEGGVDLIRIKDDGIGIRQNDLPVALERFATSKARTVEDVYNITTYGFRGEALPAIGSVSDLNIKSVTLDNQGAQIDCVYGAISKVRSAAISKGTQITVKNLFENLPVRKKFLKSRRSNEIEILRFIKQMSYHNSSVQFIVTFNEKEVYRTYPGNTMLDIAKKIFDEDSLIFHTEKLHDIEISVSLSSPLIQKKRRDSILVGVNGRVIKDFSVVQAVIQGYHRIIPAGSYPCCIVDIRTLPNFIDANIHPTKSEVRFIDSSLFFKGVYNCVGEALKKFNLQLSDFSDIEDPEIGFEVEEKTAAKKRHLLKGGIPERKEEPLDLFSKISIINNAKKEPVKNNAPLIDSSLISSNIDESSIDNCDLGQDATLKSGITSGITDFFKDNLVTNALSYEQKPLASPSKHSVVGQLCNTYIICESGEGDLLIIDQHVAHERVLFDKYKSNHIKSVPSISLFEPIVVDLDDNEIDFLESFVSEYLNFGYRFEIFGSSSIKIDMIPIDILRKDVKSEFLSILNDAMALKKSNRQDYSCLVMACKQAVKAGDALNTYEMQLIVDSLFESTNPYTCPHGRPIVYRMSNSDLSKKFHR